MTDPRCGEHGVLKTTCAGWKHHEKRKQTVEYWREKARVSEAELARLREMAAENVDIRDKELAKLREALADHACGSGCTYPSHEELRKK